jgi:hypothetical protein
MVQETTEQVVQQEAPVEPDAAQGAVLPVEEKATDAAPEQDYKTLYEEALIRETQAMDTLRSERIGRARQGERDAVVAQIRETQAMHTDILQDVAASFGDEMVGRVAARQREQDMRMQERARVNQQDGFAEQAEQLTAAINRELTDAAIANTSEELKGASALWNEAHRTGQAALLDQALSEVRRVIIRNSGRSERDRDAQIRREARDTLRKELQEENSELDLSTGRGSGSGGAASDEEAFREYGRTGLHTEASKRYARSMNIIP